MYRACRGLTKAQRETGCAQRRNVGQEQTPRGQARGLSKSEVLPDPDVERHRAKALQGGTVMRHTRIAMPCDPEVACSGSGRCLQSRISHDTL